MKRLFHGRNPFCSAETEQERPGPGEKHRAVRGTWSRFRLLHSQFFKCGDGIFVAVFRGSLEPSYRDILSKVFERKKERTNLSTPPRTETIQEYQAPQNFGDYSSLKKHYQTNGIDFKEYKKSNVNRRYNTNLLQLINSVVLFVLSGLSSAILFWIISATGNLKSSTNFMYYTFPIIFAVYAIYSLIKFKCFSSKKAAIKLNEATNWIVFLLVTLIIVIVNTICGMQAELMAKYLTSLLLPVVNVLILFPIHFYCKKFLYSKYSR